MNNTVEVLEATSAFVLADERYITLIQRAINSHGEPRKSSPTTMEQKLEQLKEAKRKRAELEAEMYAVWCREGLGCEDELS